MRKIKFEIVFDEIDLQGDEFWEDALSEDGTGINALKNTLADIIDDSNLLISGKKASDIIKLIEYKA